MFQFVSDAVITFIQLVAFNNKAHRSQCEFQKICINYKMYALTF